MAPPTSSESWSAELFPKSHPRHNNKAGGNGGSGASISGASMSHPHIRELVERQQQIKQLQRQLDTTNTTNTQQHQGGNIKELYYSGKSKNVIQGLHMNHILTTNDNNSLEDGTSLLQSVNSQSQYNHHPLSPHLNHSGPPQSSANSIHRNNIHRNTQHLNNTMNNTGYEIEGTFQSKGCIPQTADDVGYLFGCGTHPHDEVVYVYNTVPNTTQQQQPTTAMADERNLFYHTGPNNTTNGGGDNVNDVLFQIDKEYQQLQSNHVENMREPPPRYPPGHYKMQQQQQHGVGNNMRVEQDDDEYTKRSGCSISSIMDLLLPNLRMNHKSRSSSTMRDSNSGYYGDYPTDNWRTLCASPTKRKRRGNKHSTLHNVVSTSSSEDSTFERTKRRAKDSVYELQQQLKAMVHDRAKSKVGTPKKNDAEESRQESSTPPVSPKPITTTEDNKQKDIEQLRQEQATLDQARKLLQVELAQHQVQLATINATNPYYNGSFGIQQGMISPLSAPIGASGGMMSSPMMTNGMLQPQLSTGMWPQQQQGMMGGMQQTGINMMQNTQVGGVVPQQVPSNVSELSKSIFTGAPQGTTQDKFISNVGAGLMSRSYSVNPTAHTTQSKKKLSPPHPTQRSYSNNDFTLQSNQRLNDLKSKNESIRKDISRMKECMNSTPSPSRRKGGRPFPRTSPPSSPTRQDRDDAIARAMQRSDEARSLLSGSSNGSVGYRSSPNRYNRGSSRRQPPSPIRTSSRGNQEYYHV